jgi:cardiolipin synthase
MPWRKTALQGNRLELLQDADEVFRSLIEAIARSRRSCHLEFYIWYAGGLADELLETVIGVNCPDQTHAAGLPR